MSESEKKILNIAVIGAGVRGTSLARKAATSGFGARIVAVAEPDEFRRTSFAAEFSVPPYNIYNDWKELCTDLQDCDGIIIATLDNQHTGPALGSICRGWHILIEKPLADTLEACSQISARQKEEEVIIAVCHTLRFMDGYRRLKEIILSGDIGEVIHIEHMEAISNIRYAHNYVRGRWGSESGNTFLLLHKCSHDIDYINWLITESCTRVSSFGSLMFFTEKNAPAGSTLRCTDGCPVADSCLYSSLRLYADAPLNEWPARDICPEHTREAHLEALRAGPYGKCVWHSGNDVVDHQVVMMEFEGGATATCTLTGYSASNGRRIRVQGTRAEVLFDEAAGTITIDNFGKVEREVINIPTAASYHPEDREIVDEWLSSLVNATGVTVNAGEAMRTHAVVFAAEISRKEGRTVEMSEITGYIK
jgi:predicted dehydrogenase